MMHKTLIVCDVQPDVVRKLPEPRQKFLDLVQMAVQASRQSTTSTTSIVYTMLKFDDSYTGIPSSHPRLGVLRRLAATTKNPQLKWFTSSKLSIMNEMSTTNDNEYVVSRTTFLPQANDTALLEVLEKCISSTTSGGGQADQDSNLVTVLGYGPTVQAMCHLLGDVLALPHVQIIRECVCDENEARCQAFLEHGLLFNEQVVPLVEYLEGVDLLHTKIDIVPSTPRNTIKYVCDCGRGGHLSLFLPYLIRDYGYVPWPTQPWYKEMSSSLSHTGSKEYHCPLGRRVVDLCDEPQFGSGTRFFLAGRQYLDEKDLLYDLVPELMPPTFHSLEAAQEFVSQNYTDSKQEPLIWFLKKVNQNGGRAVTVIHGLPNRPLAKDEQLQLHIPNPLLFHEHSSSSPNRTTPSEKGIYKCHVKTYVHIACVPSNEPGSATCWQLYMHDLFYLLTASRPWSVQDLSDEAQITTLRTHRLYRDHPWRVKWQLTEKCHTRMATVLERAVQQGKLQQTPGPVDPSSKAALQFEINSADWMLDESGRIYLIECNGIPVLYDAGTPQALITRGLKSYDKLYKENPETAVVNDHDLIEEGLALALKGCVTETSLWKHVATIPSGGQ